MKKIIAHNLKKSFRTYFNVDKILVDIFANKREVIARSFWPNSGIVYIVKFIILHAYKELGSHVLRNMDEYRDGAEYKYEIYFQQIY